AVERVGGGARADRPRVRRVGGAPRRDAPGGPGDRPRAARGRHPRDQAPPGAHPRRARSADLRPHAAAADDPPGRGRGMSSIASPPDWAEAIQEHAAEDTTARRLIAQLVAVEVAALAFCRLLERWARGEADPSTPGRRQAALRRAADRVETALAG